MAATGAFRGLTVFISDLRNCQSKEQERARVDKELANIRTKFKSDKGLSSYERKKYVWKLLYIYVLGYDIEFGHMEAVSLISSTKFSEKQVGYIAASVLLNENLEFVRLVINTMQKDLTSRDENVQCMALTAIANMGGREFAEALGGEVEKVLVSSTTRPVVKKKAALCLLRLFRRSPDIIHADTWSSRMANLLQERDLGVLLSSMALLNGLVAHDATGYEPVVAKVVAVLERLSKKQNIPQDYTYYGIASPWLHIKALRVLHYFPVIDNDAVFTRLTEILRKTITETDVSKNVNKNNALHAMLFESISLLMHLDVETDLLGDCISLLGKFISIKEPNIRYLGLENMSRLSVVPEMMTAIREHRNEITLSLRDPDISIRRRALDLLYGMCDHGNSGDVVGELLDYLTTADFAIREELTLKIAILAEKYASSLQWYIDVTLTLIDKAGDHVGDEVWYRVVQIVTNHEELQRHAAANVLDKLESGSSHEIMVKVASYILGEFGHLVAAPAELFRLLKQGFATASSATKGLVLSALAKIMSRHPGDADLSRSVLEVFKRYESYPDAELQQRAVEYARLLDKKEAGMVMASMPKFPERESSLLKKVNAESAPAGASLPLERERVEADALPAPQPQTGVADLLGVDLLEGSVPTVAPTPAAPPVAMAVANGAGPAADPMDLLAGLSVQDAGPPPAPVAAAVSDPFAGASSDLLVEPSATQASTQPTVVGGTIEGWLNKLCRSDKGVLYQDQYLQIGVKSDYARGQGRIVFFLGNKHTSDLDSFSMSVPPFQSCRLQLGPAPKAIVAQTQVQVQLSVSCVEPSLQMPLLQVAYVVGGQPVKISLKLPVIPCKFFDPVQNIDGNVFFSQWKAIEGPPLKLQQIVQASSEVDVEKVSALFSGMGIGVARGLDPNPNNLVGVATFHSETVVEALVMVRMEIDPNTRKQFRMTVASAAHQALPSATKDILLKLIQVE